MNKLDELIKELCPNGVEYKELGEIVKSQRGKTITKELIKDGDIPVISGGQKPAYYHNESNRKGEVITVAGSGAYAGFVMYWDKPIFVSDAFSIECDKSYLNIKYIYYFLQNNQMKIHSLKKGGGVPHVYFKDMQEYQHYLTQIQCFFKYSEEEIKGYAIINFEIQEDGKIVINFSNSMNKEVNKRIAYIIVKEMKRWTPATDEKNRPIKAEGYLIAYFEVKPYVENPTYLKIN